MGLGQHPAGSLLAIFEKRGCFGDVVPLPLNRESPLRLPARSQQPKQNPPKALARPLELPGLSFSFAIDFNN